MQPPTATLGSVSEERSSSPRPQQHDARSESHHHTMQATEAMRGRAAGK